MTRGSKTAERLLVAAETALVEGGGDLEMATVARSANVSVGLAYHYFGSKAGLIAAVVERYYERLDREVIMAEIPAADWRARERDRTARHVAFQFEHPMAEIILTRLRREESVVAIERAYHARQVVEGGRNMRDGQRRGAVDPTIDPAAAAAFVLGGARAVIAEALETPRAQRPDKVTVADRIWRLIERAVAPDPASSVQNTMQHEGDAQ